MPTHIIVPLGLIVDTDVIRACESFARLFTTLKLDINTFQLLSKPEVQSLFQAFNLGRRTIAEFRDDLLAQIKKSIPETAKPLQGWEEAWNDRWLECWTDACKINEQTIATLNLILAAKDKGIEVLIVSETNAADFEHIMTLLATAGIDINRFTISSSHIEGKPVNVIIYEFVAAKTKNSDRVIRIRGSTDHIMKRPMPFIKDKAVANGVLSVFKKMADDKEIRIANPLGIKPDIVVKTISPNANQSADTPLQLSAEALNRIVQHEISIIEAVSLRASPTPLSP